MGFLPCDEDKTCLKTPPRPRFKSNNYQFQSQFMRNHMPIWRLQNDVIPPVFFTPLWTKQRCITRPFLNDQETCQFPSASESCNPMTTCCGNPVSEPVRHLRIWQMFQAASMKNWKSKTIKKNSPFQLLIINPKQKNGLFQKGYLFNGRLGPPINHVAAAAVAPAFSVSWFLGSCH